MIDEKFVKNLKSKVKNRTVYMWKAIQQLKKDGQTVTDGNLCHLSPCRFEHINKLGKFNFEAMKRLGLRPLRAFK